MIKIVEVGEFFKWEENLNGCLVKGLFIFVGKDYTIGFCFYELKI